MQGEPGDTNHQALVFAGAGGGCFGGVWQSQAISHGWDNA